MRKTSMPRPGLYWPFFLWWVSEQAWFCSTELGSCLTQQEGPPKLINYNQNPGLRPPCKRALGSFLLERLWTGNPETTNHPPLQKSQENNNNKNNRVFYVTQTWIYTQLWDELAGRTQASISTLMYFDATKVEKLRLRGVQPFAWGWTVS